MKDIFRPPKYDPHLFSKLSPAARAWTKNFLVKMQKIIDSKSEKVSDKPD